MITDLRSSLLAKIIALFLIGLLSAAIIFCGFGIAYLGDGGAYHGTGSFFNGDICQGITYNNCLSVIDKYSNDPAGSWINDYTPASTNFGFEIYAQNDMTAPVLKANVPSDRGYSYKLNDKDYVLVGYVAKNITAQDSYFYPYQVYQSLLQNSNLLLWGIAACCLAWLAVLIFLCCAAGHRRGEVHVLPNYLDLMPLDLWLVLVGFSFALCGEVMDSYYDLTPINLFLMGAGLLLIILILIATILTVATRVKLGKWWRNTIIYKLLRFFWKILRGIFTGLSNAAHALPMIWKTLLLLILFIILQSIFSISSDYNAGSLMILLLMDSFILLQCGRISISLQRLQEAGAHLAGGDPEYRVNTKKMPRILRDHGENLNSIGGGIRIAVEQRMKSERMKTELITNVSHDIKTPLTSILNYVDLLQKTDDPAQQQEYLVVLDRQAKRLKKLTEDLVEASKAATGNLQVTLKRTDFCELLRQAAGEYEERLAANGLTPLFSAPEEPLYVMADGRLLWRVIDNLLNNACKYAQQGTRVYLDIREVEGFAVLTVRNISRLQLNIEPTDLLERFVRGDSSRNTEGSGLGLNIAKSLTELQQGTLDLLIDGDLFKVTVSFPAME